MKANSPIWPSGKTVQVMVVDETDIETDVALTTVGVTEREIIADSYSEYYYHVTVEAGHEYTVYFISVEDDPYFASEVLRSPETVDLTTVTNALAALQTDLGNPSVDATTIYAQVLLIKAYVDELETRLSAVRAGYLDKIANATYGLEAIKDAVDLVAPIPGTNTITITVLDANDDPIPDAFVGIYNGADELVNSGTSNANGELVIGGVVGVSLNDGTYYKKARKSMVNFPSSEAMVVDSTHLTFTIEGTVISATAPPSSDLQTLSMTIRSGGVAQADITVRAVPSERQIVNSAVLAMVKLEAVTDVNGYAELTLDKGGKFEIIAGTSGEHLNKRITVTSAATADISGY